MLWMVLCMNTVQVIYFWYHVKWKSVVINKDVAVIKNGTIYWFNQKSE